MADKAMSGSGRRRRSQGGSAAPAPRFWKPLFELAPRRPSLALVVLLAIALLFGGGGSPAPMAELVVQIAALAALAWAALSRRPDFGMVATWRRAPLLFSLGLLLALYMIVQLVPLPADVWHGLPGRAPIVENASTFPGKLSHGIALEPWLTFAALLSLLPPLAGFMIASGTRATERDWLLPMLAIFAGVTIFLELLQLGGLASFYGTRDLGFATGFQANRNQQGDILAILLVALACRPFTGRDRASFAMIQAVGTLVVLIAVVMTGSRAGLAMCLGVAGIAAIRELLALRSRMSGKALAAIVGAFALVLVVGAAVLATNANVAQTLERFAKGEEARQTVIWPDAWYTVQQFSPWGAGFGNFVPAFKIFESQELINNTVANRAHNEVLELLIEGGIAALVLALAALALILWRGWRGWRSGATPLARTRGAMLLLVSLLLAAHSLVDYPIRSMSIAVFWAILLGLVIADASDATDRAASPEGSARKAPRRTAGQFAVLGATLLALVLLVPLLFSSALDRDKRQQPFGLSCVLPTPNSCLTQIAGLLAQAPQANLSPLTQLVASRNPANALAQSIHGTQLLAHGDPRGTIFLHNSARLGWREPLGQINTFDAALAAGDVPLAVIHLDALYRAHPDFLAQRPLLDRAVADLRVRQEWAARLAAAPEYIRDLYDQVARDGVAAEGISPEAWNNRIELLSLARGNGLKVDPKWSELAMNRVFARNRLHAADLWTAMAGPGGWAKGEVVWSNQPKAGQLPERTNPFTWSAAPGRASWIEVERREGKPARMVMTRAANGPATRLATIAVFLGEGYHELRWRTSGGEPNRLFPSVSCVKGSPVTMDLLDAASTDRGVAAVKVGSDCGGAMVIINKGNGPLAKGAAIDELELDRKRLLL